MPFYEYIAIGLMVVFILALFTGYPVAWLLAGLSLLFATIGITLGDMGYDTFLMTSWAKFSCVIDRFDSIMSNWVLVSLPMSFVPLAALFDDAGFVRSFAVSAAAFARNPGAFIVYAAIAFALLAVGLLTMGIGLVIALPLIACATFVAWRDLCGR